MEKSYLRNLIKKVLMETINQSELEDSDVNQTTTTDSSDTPDSSSNNIICIQKALTNAGFGNLLGNSGPNGDGIDGKYGNNTKIAVTKYQESKNISNPGTGFVGPVTAKSMGCKRLETSKDRNKKSLVNPKPKPVKEPEDSGGAKCPSIANSPSFRQTTYIVDYWQKKYPNLKTKNEVIGLIDRMVGISNKTFSISSMISKTKG
jgi:peptidoglycan hydrolase-like protein with peptidoglycan-binding domain